MAREILETIDPQCGCALFGLPHCVPADKLQLIFPPHYLAFDYTQYYGYTFLHQLGFQRSEIRSDSVDWTALSGQTGLSVSTTGLKGVPDIDFVVEEECFNAVIAQANATRLNHKVTSTVSSPKLDLINFVLPTAQVSIAKNSPLSVHSPTHTFSLNASFSIFRINGTGEPHMSQAEAKCF